AFIGIMWINHHRLFSHIRRSDNGLLSLNLLLLLGVCVVPFPTAVVAKQWAGGDRRTAMLLYNATYLAIAVLFNLLWRYCISRGGKLLGSAPDLTGVRKIAMQYAIGPIAYMICLLLALVSVNASLAMNAALAIYFAMPPAQSVKLMHKEER